MDPEVWKPTVGYKKVAKEKKPAFDARATSIANDFDPEEAVEIKKADKSLADAIRDARALKGMKQVELDKACNLPKNTVQSYESQNAIYNPTSVNKIGRYLGVKLPRPKAQSKAQSKDQSKGHSNASK
jgi:ribosome-binding protein aMBF1 (putative translation factor)